MSSACQFGPPHGARAVAAELFYGTLLREAGAAGVTRLAQITGLDRIGFPVWQAVRPAGRAQSVHQGKGCCDLDAKIGALGEALESHWAESVEPDGPHARWEDLPPANRCLEAADCYADKPGGADPGRIDWCKATDLRTGRAIYLPHLFVSLDFTLPTATAFERSSAGLALGTSMEEAVETAILELLERDAIGAWQRMPTPRKARHRVDLKTIPFRWFEYWGSRIRAAGASVRVFAVEALDRSPVCIVYLGGTEAYGDSQRLFMGSAAHCSPEIALFKALAEAVQSRLTLIAGARDDMLPSLYRRTPPGSLLGTAGLRARRVEFARLRSTCSGPDEAAKRLAALGYPTLAVKRLSPA
ncbi:MAG: YcaO-like family protein, partial [Sphingomonas sp.]|nr:YcaO-like family protein [Sphingomonas sp.]